MTKDETRLIMTRARIATLEARLAELRNTEQVLIGRIGHDPSLIMAIPIDAATFEKLLSSEEFAHRIKEATEMFSEIAREDLARASAWKPLERRLTLNEQ